MKTEALVPAAGLGLRMGGLTPKPFVRIGRKPLIVLTLEALLTSRYIRRIIVAVHREYFQACNALFKKYTMGKSVDLVIGGALRQDSVFECLKQIRKDTEIVVVHDVARPFIARKILDESILLAARRKAVIVGVPLTNTLKRIDNRGRVCRTVARGGLWEIQTPQVFKKEILFKAYECFGHVSVTDDASLVEKLGIPVYSIEGSRLNIKITTPEDLILAELIQKQISSLGFRKRHNT